MWSAVAMPIGGGADMVMPPLIDGTAMARRPSIGVDLRRLHRDAFKPGSWMIGGRLIVADVIGRLGDMRRRRLGLDMAFGPRLGRGATDGAMAPGAGVAGVMVAGCAVAAAEQPLPVSLADTGSPSLVA